MRSGLVVLVCLVAGCSGAPRRMALQRVILYQNGIGYFERAGQVGGDRILLPFSRHELDDVIKTLTVIDRRGAGVATVEVPVLRDKDAHVTLGVRMTGGGAHDVAVSYAVPTPTWKAAYRVVLDDTTEQSPALLQGWAKIDNASQEDWRNIRLTLATGAPMSYALDLHTPTYVDRPDVTGKLVSPVVTGRVENEKASAAAGDPDDDRVANADDLCPGEPEDKDGFEDDDGCPELDNDKDRIADRSDKCPNDPETYNGLDDDDGCPDRGRVVVTDTAIEILDNVYFAAGSDSVRRESLPIVDAVAATLVANPSIKVTEVQGHADASERDSLRLSDRRAAAVQAALMAKGVPASRLTVQGYGDTQPIDRGATEQARAKNRRVAFLILKRSSDESDRPVNRPPPPPIDTRTVQASARTQTRPVEVAGAVRYEIATPVSVPRGASTLVAILNKPITAEDAYLFRPDGNAPGSERHPFRAVRLVNTSGFTLQPGSIAIFARGTFVGDSLLDRLELDETAWIPYAIDSGTQVTSAAAAAERPVRIVALHRGVLTVENAGIRTTTYRIAAGRQPARRIYLRHAKAPGFTVKELPAGSIDQGDAYLLAVSLAPAKVSELVIEEREPRRRTLELIDGRGADLGVYVEGGGLPPGVGDKIKEAVRLRKEMGAVEEEIKAARRKLDDVSARSYEIRESLRALEKVRTADDLRKKLVGSLATATQDQEQLTKEITAKSETLAAARGRLMDAIRDRSLDEPGAPKP
ncbi:MAG TPA: OmpA family protein [Kofleriaceae bacterium]|nr:OmpA family protein [Kofleriaceae bacterium]